MKTTIIPILFIFLLLTTSCTIPENINICSEKVEYSIARNDTPQQTVTVNPTCVRIKSENENKTIP